MHPPSDRLLSAKEAADYIGVSLKRLYEFCKDGSLRHLRLAETAAGVLRFRRVWLDSWAEAKATGGDAIRPRPEEARKRGKTTRRQREQRYLIVAVFDVQPVIQSRGSAATLEDAVRVAQAQTDHQLAIYDTNGGHFLIVWMGTPDEARDSALLLPCGGCNHLAIEHFREDVGCRRDGCTCQELRS